MSATHTRDHQISCAVHLPLIDGKLRPCTCAPTVPSPRETRDFEQLLGEAETQKEGHTRSTSPFCDKCNSPWPCFNVRVYYQLRAASPVVPPPDAARLDAIHDELVAAINDERHTKDERSGLRMACAILHRHQDAARAAGDQNA